MSNVPGSLDAPQRPPLGRRHPSTPVADPTIVTDAEQLLQRARELVQRHDALQDRLDAEAGDDDITSEAFERSGSSRSWDLLLLTQETISRLTASDLSDDQFAEMIARVSTSPACGCCWAGCENHDQLVDWFRLDTPARAAEVLVEAVTYSECDQADRVPFQDWPDFIAEHNWPDPPATRVAAVAASELVGHQQRLAPTSAGQ